MLFPTKTARLALFFAAFFRLTSASDAAYAADAAPSSSTPPPTVTSAPTAPGQATDPVINGLIDPGTKTYFLGNRSGLDGWLLMKDGQMQVAYTTPDKKVLIIGAMFGADGYSITHEQMETLAKTDRDVAVFLQNSMKKQAEAAASSLDAPAGAPPPIADAEKPHSSLDSLFPPSERLLNDMEGALGVDVGDAHAPTLFMIMDPNCPHCQATWKALRDAVFNKKLRIHLIPIGRNEEDERAATRLLLSTDPLNAWDKYVAGDKTQLAGEADPKLLLGIQTNHVLVDKWSITETPYLLYRAKNGKIKVLEGEPKEPQALPDDIEQVE